MEKKTNWDQYYHKPFKASSITRKITAKVLLNFIKKHQTIKNINVIEIGGANSCFWEIINNDIKPLKYIIIDNNQFGLDQFAKKVENPRVKLINNDILDPEYQDEADVVFSVGLVEHFFPEDTEKAIINHFKYAGANGIIIISFPTPTLLYRIFRKLAEIMRLWMFPDERPIKLNEVIAIVERYGVVLETKILYSIIFTQAFVVVTKDNHTIV